MADGRYKSLAELEVGDGIYGTIQEGRYRRYAQTTVLAKWTSVKEAYRIKLEEGTELIASSDARDRAAHQHPRARLEAVAELNRAGIPTGVLIAPLMPGINDAPEQLEPLLELAAAAGATSIGGVTLHLRGDVKDVFMDWLRSQRPDLVERYEQLYRQGAYAPVEERKRLSRLVRWQGVHRGYTAHAAYASRADGSAGTTSTRPGRAVL